jgi:hypothetical protein
VLLAEKLEAGITDLDTGLTEVDRDDFTHVGGEKGGWDVADYELV